MLQLIRSTAKGFADHNCMRMAAAIAYYALFSLPPLLVIAITLAGYLANLVRVSDDGQIRSMVQQRVTEVLGEDAALQVDKMIEQANTVPGSTAGFVIGTAVFLFSASVVLVQLQSTMNEVWSVRPNPSRGGVSNFMIKRLISLAMALVLSILLLASVLLSTLLTIVGNQVGKLLPEGMTSTALQVGSVGVDFVLATLMFAATYKWLSYAKIAWQDVWLGAAVTGILFILGKSLLTYYIAKVNLGSTYGAAGSLALILIWVYLSASLLLIGAEFTRALTVKRSGAVTPLRGAVAVETTVRTAS